MPVKIIEDKLPKDFVPRYEKPPFSAVHLFLGKQDAGLLVEGTDYILPTFTDFTKSDVEKWIQEEVEKSQAPSEYFEAIIATREDSGAVGGALWLVKDPGAATIEDAIQENINDGTFFASKPKKVPSIPFQTIYDAKSALERVALYKHDVDYHDRINEIKSDLVYAKQLIERTILIIDKEYDKENNPNLWIEVK